MAARVKLLPQAHAWLQWVALLAAVALLPASALAAVPDAWTPAINLSHTPGRSTDTAIEIDPISGDIMVVWTEDGVAEFEEIVGRRRDHAAGGWLPAENLSQSADWERDGGPALVFNRQGQGLLIWTRTYSAGQGAPDDGYDVLWRAWDGAAWSPAQVLLHGSSYLPGSPGTFGLIPVERPDSILLFITWGTGYRTAEYQDGAWSAVAPWIYLDVALGQVVEDGQGNLHAAALGPNSNQNGNNRWFRDAYYLSSEGGGAPWSEPVNLAGTEGVASNAGLAFDGQGRLHFLWSDPDSVYSDESLRSAIWERVYDGGSWSPNVEATAWNDAQAINGFSLAAGVTGTLHLAWSEGLQVAGAHTGLDVYYQSGDGTAWEPEQKVYTSTAQSRYPLLVVGGDGAVLAWQEEFDAGGPVLDLEVYASRQGDTPPPVMSVYLPLIAH